MGRRGRRLTGKIWKPAIRPLFVPVEGQCFIGLSKSLRTPINNTEIEERRASNLRRLRKEKPERPRSPQVIGGSYQKSGLSHHYLRKGVKELLKEFYQEETQFVSPPGDEESLQPEERTDSSHLNFIDFPLRGHLGITSAATKFGPLGGSPPFFSVITPGGEKPEFSNFGDERYRRAVDSEPGWVPVPKRAAVYENENIVDGESYKVWRWTRDTVASIVSAWRAWETIQETPSRTHEILKKLYACYGGTYYFLPPELNSEHYGESDVIPYYEQQPNYLGQIAELPKRKELKELQYQLKKDLDPKVEKKFVAFLHLYFKSQIARLLKNKLVEEDYADIANLEDDFHLLDTDRINKQLAAYQPETATATLQGHIVNCLSHHVIPPPGTNAPRFSCCAQCHKWTRISGRSRIKVWGGKLYCSPSCRSASALMTTRLKDPETNHVNFKLLLEATKRADQRIKAGVNSLEWEIHERSDAKKERPDKEVILGRLITCIYENLRRNMSVDRLLKGHFRIEDNNSEDYERLKQDLEDVRQAGRDYPYFDWDSGVPE